MFNQIGWGEIAVLLLLTLFVVGPERLPGLAADAGKGLRQLRGFMKGMASDLKAEVPELGDVDLASLHPRTFVRKHLWDDDEEAFPAAVAAAPVSFDKAGASRGSSPLGPGETAPWDPDTT